MNKNHLITGVIIGFIVPVLVFFLFYYFTFGQKIELSAMFGSPGLLAKMVGLSLIGNLAAFMYLLQKKDLDKTARGILLSTFIYGLAIGVLKILESMGK